MINRIGAERGWPPITREQFDRAAGPAGALYVGAPATVAGRSSTPPACWDFTVQSEIQRRNATARRADDEHRADRDGGRPRVWGD